MPNQIEMTNRKARAFQMISSPIASILAIWFFWWILLFAFQAFVQLRIQLVRPDTAIGFSAKYTQGEPIQGWPSKTALFITSHKAWDSTYYLSIAENGYDDPGSTKINSPGSNETYSLNYAFFPLYPISIRIISYLPQALGIPIPNSSILAGVAVSLVGTLAAMISLFHLTVRRVGPQLALNAPFFLVIFPMAVFLPQVYTEGLFLGLSFTGLLFMEHKNYRLASLFCLLAALTRPNGILLIVPFFLYLIWDVKKEGERSLIKIGLKLINQGWPGVLILGIFGAWYISPWGAAFRIVDRINFGRGFLEFQSSAYVLANTFNQLFKGSPQNTSYLLLEISLLLLAVVACVIKFKREPILSLYSALLVFLPLTSGQFQSMSRYVIAMPILFLFITDLSKYKTFEKIWPIFSLLLFALVAILFSFDFWVA